mmetsp:Transcript_22063/g.68995  ORF Transcript_22063/g.68995 Transcript_22063/m.68995 type:complete len:978 (+) Transcript_22063:338-3271(+)
MIQGTQRTMVSVPAAEGRQDGDAVLSASASSHVIPTAFVYRDIARFFCDRLKTSLVDVVKYTASLGCEAAVTRRLVASGGPVRDLFEHQYAFATWASRRMAKAEVRLSINASAPGSGKTLAVLSAVLRCESILVLAPDHLAGCWRREAARLGVGATEWSGSDVVPQSQVVILGYTRLTNSNIAYRSNPPTHRRRWNVLVVDEMHLLGQSKHTVKKKFVSDLVPRVQHVIGVSGTQLSYGVAHWRHVVGVLAGRSCSHEPLDRLARRYVFRAGLDCLCDRARASLPHVRIEPIASLEATPVEKAVLSRQCDTGALLLPWTAPSLAGSTKRDVGAPGEAETKRRLLVKAESGIKRALVDFCATALRSRHYDRILHELRHDRQLRLDSKALRAAFYASSVATRLPEAAHLRAAMLPAAEQLDWLQQMADCVPWSQHSRFNLDDYWSQDVTDAQKLQAREWRAALQDDDFSWLLACTVTDRSLLDRQPHCVLGRLVVANNMLEVAATLERLGRAHRAMVEAVTNVCSDDYASDERLMSYLHCSAPDHPLRAVGNCGEGAKRSPARTAQPCLLCRAISAQAEFMAALEACVPFQDRQRHGHVAEDPSRVFLMHADVHCIDWRIRSEIRDKARRLAHALDVHSQSMCRHHNGLHFNVQWLLRSYDHNDRAYPCAEQVLTAFLEEYLARLPPQTAESNAPVLRHFSSACAKAHRLGRRCKCHPFHVRFQDDTAPAAPSMAALGNARSFHHDVKRLRVTRDIGTKLDHVLTSLEKTEHALVISDNIESLRLLHAKASHRRTHLITCATSARHLPKDNDPDIVLLHSGHADLATCVDISIVSDIIFVEVPAHRAKVEQLLHRLVRLDVSRPRRQVTIHANVLRGYEFDDGFDQWLRSTLTVGTANSSRHFDVALRIEQIAMGNILNGDPTSVLSNPITPRSTDKSLSLHRGTPVRVIISPVRASALLMRGHDHGESSGYKVRRITY